MHVAQLNAFLPMKQQNSKYFQCAALAEALNFHNKSGGVCQLKFIFIPLTQDFEAVFTDTRLAKKSFEVQNLDR